MCWLLPEPKLIWTSLHIACSYLFHGRDTALLGKNMPPMRPEELTARINNSHMNSETKEILKLFKAMFTLLQLERNSKIKTLEKKMTEIKSKTVTLVEELNDIKKATEHDISILKEEDSSLKQK